MLARLIILTAVLTGSAVSGQQPARQSERGARGHIGNDVEAHRDLVYARVGDSKLLLDVFVPRKVKNAPLLVWIHGGAWQGGSKGNGGRFLSMTEQGYAVASINYRLSGEATFPAQIHDCKAAIRFLRANAGKYGYNASRIGVGGSSAGGHLVALLGTSGGSKELEGGVGGNFDQSSRVQAVCDMWGPTDFLQMDSHAIPGARLIHNASNSPESLLIGGPIQENRDKVAQADPITYVDKDDPAFLILHGDKDPSVPVHQSHLLNTALTLADVEVKLHIVEGAGHGGRQFSTPEINRMIAAFFEKHVRSSRDTQRGQRQRGSAKVEVTRPKHFPHRIWAACDFEGKQYAWFGPALTDDIPKYAGNKTAMGVAARPYKRFSGIMTGINPVPGPRLGKVNYLYLRYRLSGATEAIFQHFSLSSSDNNHIRVSGLTEGKWSEVTMNFSRDGQRNDGTRGVPFKAGERMDDLKIHVGKPNDGKQYDLLVDDIIFFANDPELPPELEPFPNRVIFLAAFDSGLNPKVRDKFWPGKYDIVRDGLPADSYWGVARAVPRKRGGGKRIAIEVKPPRPVGARTKLRFRYHLTGASKMTVQMFDLTDMDNRHIRLADLKQGEWRTVYLDFTKASRRNDGGDTPFAAGHLVDLISFLVQPQGDKEVRLLIDEVVLFDAA